MNVAASDGLIQTNDVLDRKRGTLLGLAIGDALGAAVEFESPGTFEPVTGFRGNGPHGIEAGQWTDDTSMALALADSIASSGWNLDDQAERYLSWFRRGEYSVNGRCFDIGMTTGMALERFEKDGDARSCGDDHPRASGNGSIMRLAPVPIHFAELYPAQLGELSRLADESSLPTHASSQCRSACRYLALVLTGLIMGASRDEVLSPDWEPLERLRALGRLHHEVEAVVAGSFRLKRPPEIVGGGYVVETLEAALWAFHYANDFREAVLTAVNLGDDSDTTGAVCGQLAGAYWGESGIPEKWLTELGKREMIEDALRRLIDKEA